MVTERKSREVIERERQQAEMYRQRVLDAVGRVPPKVQNGSYQMAVSFKKDAAAAYKMAKSTRVNLLTMQRAWNLIAFYYAGEKE